MSLAAAPFTATALIPAHNEEATIGDVVRAVRCSTYPLERVIVVADSCTDRTAELARAAGAEVLEVAVSDKAEAQNAVLGLITTDLVVGFDADTFPEPRCVERMVDRMVRDGYDAVCATILPAQDDGMFIRARLYAYALGRRWWRAAQSVVGRVQVLTGACYVFKTAAIRSIGGFPSVGISADMDATWSLHAKGYKLAYVGDAIAYTVDPETLDDYRKQMERWSSGFFQTMAKHRRQLWHPKSMLVVWTGLFDLLCLPIGYVIGAWASFHEPKIALFYLALALVKLTVTTWMVATTVGWREALRCIGPYLLVNAYNKWLYLRAFTREWLLDSHYASWTGRHGRARKVTPVSKGRVVTLVAVTVLGAGAYVRFVGVTPPPFWQVALFLLVLPMFAVMTVGRANA